MVGFAAEGDFPAVYETTTRLNVRESNNTSSKKISTLAPHTQIEVNRITSNNWAEIKINGNIYYVSARYIKYVRSVGENKTSSIIPKKSGKKDIWDWFFTIAICVIGFCIIRMVALYGLGLVSVLMYKLYWIVCIPFYILNWFQRHLSKPWRFFHKRNKYHDTKNKELREKYEKFKFPIYIIMTPLRLINAVYYNIFVHCSFEMLNYLIEVFRPSNEKEGADDFFRLFVFFPWRLGKYVVWHGGLTFIESVIWTAVDTFVPALTLFHGTDETASTSITNAGRSGYSNNLTGVWNVGGGNYAGNGIYFAPVRSTALHYSRGSLIVCRVSLGKVLDLGLAPNYVYNQCGYPNALGATKWGLENGYVTGEWWRKDTGWWEYCMYDWQNRYNHSWRIRPLYVLNLNEKYMQRIPGGMSHWLFRKMVIQDLKSHFNLK